MAIDVEHIDRPPVPREIQQLGVTLLAEVQQRVLRAEIKDQKTAVVLRVTDATVKNEKHVRCVTDRRQKSHRIGSRGPQGPGVLWRMIAPAKQGLIESVA